MEWKDGKNIFGGFLLVKIDDGGDFSFSWIGQLFSPHRVVAFCWAACSFLFGQQNKGEKKRLGSFSLWCFRFVVSSFLWEMRTKSYSLLFKFSFGYFWVFFIHFGSFLTVLDEPSLIFWSLGLVEKCFLHHSHQVFGASSTLEEWWITICHFSAFTTHGRAFSSPFFSISTIKWIVVASLSWFMVLFGCCWHYFLCLISFPCKEILPYKCDLGERCSYTTNEMLADNVEVHDFHIILSYVILKHFSNFIVLHFYVFQLFS